MSAAKTTINDILTWKNLILGFVLIVACGAKAVYDIADNEEKIDKQSLHYEERLSEQKAQLEKSEENFGKIVFEQNKMMASNNKDAAVMKAELEAVRRQNSAILIKQDKQAEKIDRLSEMVIEMIIKMKPQP